jgi:malate dehydrogenase
MARAVITDSREVMPVCAWVTGEYGISGVYLGVEAEIGRAGVNKVVAGKLTAQELEELKKAAEAVRSKQADVKDL